MLRAVSSGRRKRYRYLVIMVSSVRELALMISSGKDLVMVVRSNTEENCLAGQLRLITNYVLKGRFFSTFFNTDSSAAPSALAVRRSSHSARSHPRWSAQ